MKQAFLYSLKNSLPIFVSFLPVGLAYGIVMQTAGYNWLWTAGACVTVLAGSLQFLMVSFFAGGVSLLAVAAMALLLNSRHIFYGIPFIEKWKGYGFWRYFLIFALPDETFSLHCANDFDDGNERHKMFSYVFSAALVMAYWMISSIIGALVGSFIRFKTDGIDFALTALFIVILMEQLRGRDARLPALIGLCSSAVCLLLIGPDGFILPSLIITVALLLVLQRRRKEV